MNEHATGSVRSPQEREPGSRMRAIVQTEYGSADVLRAAEIERPVIADDEVLVRVQAAGLDRGTWHMMAGQPYMMRVMGYGLRAPKNRVPGLDVSGTVVATGADVVRFAVGDDVFGISRGSFAEYACARADKLALKPANLTFDQAAVVAVSGLTALQGLCDVGRVESGQRVLIVGASGGVGTFAVQIAQAFGAQVDGVCGPTKVDLVRALGADHVIDYTRDDFADAPGRYDLILDIGGNSPLSRLRRALTPSGTLVMVGGENGGRWTGGLGRQLRAVALSPFVRQRLVMKTPKEHHADLERLARLVEAGNLTAVIDRTYPLEQAPDAMRHLQAGHARGKLVITVAEGA
jgi:NADPH:quinone reductase-like Zn-dependent oxidoreductase